MDAVTPKQIAAADRRVLATVMDVPINVMLAIGVVIGAAVMGLTAYTAVADRMREYGVLKAVGADRNRLIAVVSMETLYRTILGFILGIGMAYAAAWLIMAIWPQFSIVIRPIMIAQTGLLAVVMTLAAAVLPIRRLNRIDPILVFKS